MEKSMDKIVALAKSRGFVYPGSEIYLSCLRKRLKMAQGMNFILIDGWNMLRMAGKKKMI